jgi:hypothetical protein
MAGVYTFHNKFHRANHHTLSGTSDVDAGLDPIASLQYPFRGIFYNTLTDQGNTYTINTNSYDWWSAFTTMGSFSGTWMLTRSLYNTVSSLSGNWNLGYNAYTFLKANSSNYDNTYTIVKSFSAEWGSPYLMFTNKAQEYTHSKTFSGQNLYPSPFYPGLSTYDWDLDSQQVAFLVVNKNIFINNPIEETVLNGGLYTLVLKQNNASVANTGYEVEFDNLYRFNSSILSSNIVNKTLSGITVINFIAINGVMYGDVILLNNNE